MAARNACKARRDGTRVTGRAEGSCLHWGIGNGHPILWGEEGICLPLGELIGDTPEARYRGIITSGSRTGRELRESWDQLMQEAQEVKEYLGEEEVSPHLQVEAEAAGGGSTDGSTRKALVRERQ